MKCGREPGGVNADTLGICPAANDSSHHGLNRGINAGRICWDVAGIFCGHQVFGTFAKESMSCSSCSFYKKVREEEGLKFRLIKVDTV